ncbi:MAG: ribonuclease H [Saprospiraceae bacterium]|nr:ribonuclease H [Saprospiraceae bacterium]
MEKPKQKYYVVWEGINPGIYLNWNECLLQVKAYPNARYKSFSTLKEAQDAYASGFSNSAIAEKKKKSIPQSKNWKDIVPGNSITVDAACQGNPGKMEYRAVEPFTGKELFHVGPLRNGTNNIGEFLALVHALALLKKLKKSETIIYSDSKTAIGWVKKKKPNTKLVFDKSNVEIKDLMTRAVDWLNSNSYSNEIRKWETEIWGEIPADFGRK